MEFSFSDEQQAFRAAVSSFAASHLRDGALERAHRPGYDWGLARTIAKQGLFGLTIPEGKGGQGGTLVDAVLAIEAVAQHCPKSADIVQAGNFGAIRTFAEFAPDALRDELLPGLLSGDALLGLCMSEPEAGSAATELSTTATQAGPDWVLNGSKVFSTHSPDATHYLVYIRFGPGTDGIGSIVVDRGAPGLSFGKPHVFMSGEEWVQLYFEDCRVPASRVVLGKGGFKRQMSGFNAERIGNAARSLALGRYAFDAAREYVAQRRQFSRPIMDFQGIQWMFAEMAVKLEAAQLLLYRAATRAETSLPTAYDTAVAKLSCNATGFEVANTAMQTMGALGYSQESLVEYCVRRTRGWQIAGGSTEVLKNRIAESVFGTRFPQRLPAKEAR